MAKKCIRVEKKNITKIKLKSLENLDFLRELADKNTPCSCFGYKYDIEQAYNFLKDYIKKY